MILEKEFEQKFSRWVKGLGGLCLKLHLVSFIGFPDRTVLLPGGRVVFLEFKRPGGVVSKHQERWIAKLRSLGFTAKVVYSFDEAVNATSETFENTIKRVAGQS